MAAQELDDAPFTIRYDRARLLFDLTIRGFWDVATVERYGRAMRDAIIRLPVEGPSIRDHLSLTDATDYPVQSQDVAKAMQRLTGDPTLAPRRLAVIVSSSLLALQARRVTPDYRLFANREDALAWLFGADDEDAA